ncbi:MAG: phospholipid-binding lipoprotein MlaA [Myxococcota bacterium]
MLRYRKFVATVVAVFALGTTFGCATSAEVDPWEKTNRKVFAFNEGLDDYVLVPVATGWDFVLPNFAQTGIRNAFDHVNRPVVMVHNLLQAKPNDAGVDLARFVINTLLGFGGLVDVASMKGVPDNDEDWGQTLGVWGVPRGPYVMLPFFGPSTPRQTAGLAMDSSSAPYSYFIPFWWSFATTGTRLINTRAFYLEEIEQSRKDAFDYYIFVRAAYLDNLASKMNDGAAPTSEDEDDLYYFDDVEEYDEGPIDGE